MIVKAINKNGPNGITFSLFLYNSIREIGNAIKLPKNTDKVPSSGSRINPKTNIIFMSPPPKLSFFSSLFPINIIIYKIANKSIPVSTCFRAPRTPKLRIWIIIKYIEKKIRTSSGIIKYVISLTTTIINNDTIPKAINNS